MNHLQSLSLGLTLLIITACPKSVEPSSSPAQLEISTQALDFKQTDRSTFTLKNTGGGLLTWIVSNIETLTWIKSFSVLSGTIPAGASVEITINLDRSKLRAGNNQDTINLKIGSEGTIKTVIIKAFLPAKPSVSMTLANLGLKTDTSIRVMASITQLGSSNITEHGHVWGTSAEPNLTDGTSLKSNLNTATSPSTFSTNIGNLKANTTYYIRAYATNAEGVAYSSVVSFKTLEFAPKDKLTGFDPFYKDQWYLENTGQFGGKVGIDVNVKSVWEQGYLGTGISIGILDDPVDHTHPDLKDNITAERVKDFGMQPCSGHGTNVAGVIAARDNGIGIQGIAPRATLYSYGVITGSGSENTASFYANIAKACNSSEHTTIAVYNGSIGTVDQTYNAPNQAIYAAFEKVTRAGFGGLGSSLVFAAGNGGAFGFANNSFLLNHYATIAVNSVVKTGEILSVLGGQRGANLWLLGPTALGSSDKYITTDPVGDCGVKGNYKDPFGATSGAAPMVTGTVALLRQINPKLTWRDVKLILAESANKTPTGGQTYKVTGKMYSNPSKDQMYESTSGFGIVDATAAMNLAKKWTLLPPMKTFEAETKTEVDARAKNVFHTSPLTVSGSTVSYIESVTIIMTVEKSAEATVLNEWDLQLISPDGKESIMYYNPGVGSLKISYLDTDTDTMYLLANNFLGSKAINGNWQLKIRRAVDGGITKIKSWKIIIRGH